MSVEQGFASIPSQPERDFREVLLDAERAARNNLLTVGTQMADIYHATPRSSTPKVFPEDTLEYKAAAGRLADAQRAVREAFSFQEDVDVTRETVDS